MEQDALLTAKPIEDLLELIIKSVGLDLRYQVVAPDQSGASPPALKIEMSGADAALLTEHNGELLHAIEHIAAKILNLESDEHERICLDADGFKVRRDRQLQRAAQEAIAHVLETGQSYAFPPMTSRERRMLHLALGPSGLPTASSGEGARRFVVLYPHEQPPAHTLPASPARSSHIRAAFRPR